MDTAQEARLLRMLEIEEIKQVKYRYLRYLMTGEIESMVDLFTEDATAEYTDGKYCFEGREPLMEFLLGAYPPGSGKHAIWNLGHPEIEINGDDTATGIWFYRHMTIDHKERTNLQQAAFYHDVYEKHDGRWLIRHTGYKRVLHETWSRDDTPSLVVEVGG